MDLITGRCSRAITGRLKVLRHRFGSMVSRVDALDPQAILARGYSLAFEGETGKLITRTGQVDPGDPVDLRVSDGTIKLKVSEGDDIK